MAHELVAWAKKTFNISDKTAAVLEASEISGRALLCLTPKQIMEIPNLAPGPGATLATCTN